ncbi:hypothetical protein EIP91_002877 [Steccherinum ochraceum]|uniref:RING-type domain-containing protein n=1 Tax=Steccherinum ochraceum TaxID=92696 RepID=A0A4R0RPC2_9APHY|nr:hypothetical protein EIP91_002877 [Steccherinum ochraceum]
MSALASLPSSVSDVPIPGPSSVATTLEENQGNPDSLPTVAALKRSASSAFDTPDDTTSRKKLKEDTEESEMAITPIEEQTVDGETLAEELEQELQCGCCSALVYRPVLVHPCQHFFCGSCVIQWVRNGGTNCPACRGISMTVTPSRALQAMADILSRASPSRARSVNERMQADEIYKPGLPLRIPTPRQPSPEPNLQANNNFVHPCPHCVSGNQWGWRCAQPIADPDSDPDNAWNADDGSPPGHAYCGNCENVLALQAPPTSRCDFCQVSFCGIGIPGRCVAAPLASQHPHGLSDLADLLQCGEVYDCFDHNAVEVDIMFDYLAAQNFTPKHIYRDIIDIITRSARQFQPLFEMELFVDVHAVTGGTDPDPTAPRQKICRVCATEVLLWGLREWWVHERKKGFLEEEVLKRPDCSEGTHAKEFNHIIAPPDAAPIASGSGSGSNSGSAPQDAPPAPPTEDSMDAAPIGPPELGDDNVPPVPVASGEVYLPVVQPHAGPSSEAYNERHAARAAMAFALPVVSPSGAQHDPPVPSSQDQVNAML